MPAERSDNSCMVCFIRAHFLRGDQGCVIRVSGVLAANQVLKNPLSSFFVYLWGIVERSNVVDRSLFIAWEVWRIFEGVNLG